MSEPVNSSTLENESARKAQFPVAHEWAYFGHAGVSPLPQCAVDAVSEFLAKGSHGCQENDWTENVMTTTREAAAKLINADAREIALIGPTTLGINLVAHGLDWQEGDEVVYYPDDYPANVYAWRELERRGVKPIAIQTDHTGVITWDVIEPALTGKTRLVAIASCHFLTGFRPDLENIGRNLHSRGVLLSLDAIQTMGAWPIDARYVDFLSADSHKWMLGPVGAGVFYVKREHQENLRPSILGSWNVQSPGFIAQPETKFCAGARRYEPGTFNIPGIAGMGASIEMLLDAGIDFIGERLTAHRASFLQKLKRLGFRHVHDECEAAQNPEHHSGIVTVFHPDRDVKPLFAELQQNGVFASMRHDRSGQAYLRFSPHFYNTEAEIGRAVDTLAAKI